jgi:predicted aspartyl protease
MHRVLTLTMALWLAGTGPALHAEVIEPDEGETLAPAETLNTGEAEGARMTVPVMVNGKGPFQFIIDTGADTTVISRELAETLALPPANKRRLVSMGGAGDVAMVKIAHLQVSSNALRHIEAPALPRKYVGADGIIGINSLKNQRIILDFMAQTMSIQPANNRAIREERDESGTITVTAKSKLGQLVLVDADANGQEIAVIVDTGGQNSVGNTPLRRLMRKGSSPESFRQVELISVVGDRVPADYTIVGKMRIGGVKMGGAAIAFADVHPFRKFGLTRRPAMLLGMDGLRAFRRVSIDFANRRVKFLMPVAPTG